MPGIDELYGESYGMIFSDGFNTYYTGDDWDSGHTCSYEIFVPNGTYAEITVWVLDNSDNLLYIYYNDSENYFVDTDLTRDFTVEAF